VSTKSTLLGFAIVVAVGIAAAAPTLLRAPGDDVRRGRAVQSA